MGAAPRSGGRMARDADSRDGMQHDNVDLGWRRPGHARSHQDARTRNTMQFRKIMVPTDFSEESKKALHSGVELARAAAGEILLVHVMEFMVNPASLGIGPVLLASQEAELRERLAGALEAMR